MNVIATDNHQRINPTQLAVRVAMTGLMLLSTLSVACAQSVILPAPRLLTLTPMGGTAGTELEVVIKGDSLDGAEQLIFSNPGIQAKPKVDDKGNPVANHYLVTISDDCPVGVYDARVMAALGISSARVFSVSDQDEVTQAKPPTTVDNAMPVQVGQIINGVLTARAINHYTFTGKAGQRIVVDCAAKGIDSKTQPVIGIADASGGDLQVQRTGGVIDYTLPADGDYLIKVHDLTYKGGQEHFFRLAINRLAADAVVQRLPRIRSVQSFSWPPVGLVHAATANEQEPNGPKQTPQTIALPCDIAGSFYPAADVDVFQFEAKQDETWWIEVASERLGHPTDPSLVVQRVGDDGTLTDVVELSDIASPVKRSSNGYSYDGPPYNAGSADILGSFTIPADGHYQIRMTDSFGGTRNDPSNRYRMVVRKAQPDFSIVGWALHMGLRNGDRNALSKPIALRGGALIPIEVVAVRRDGFDGPIDLKLDSLPEGVTATGLTIGKGKTRGILLIAADENAPRGLEFTQLWGSAEINGAITRRQGHMASMKWPVPNAASEIPDPRLLDQFPISVGGVEQAGLSIVPEVEGELQATVGDKVTLSLKLIRRGEFSGSSMSLKTFGSGFEKAAAVDFSLTDPKTDVVIDLAKLKTPAGKYTIAFYGGAVQKYAAGGSKPNAKTKDIVDIFVSQPLTINVQDKEAADKLANKTPSK